MDSFTLVIFGITSNLAQIKLIPTLYDLFANNRIGANFTVIGIGRKPMNLADFNAYVGKTLRTKNRHHSNLIDPNIESKLLSHLEYLPVDLTDHASFIRLKELIQSSPNSTNRMYYLATFPSLYHSIFSQLKSVNLTGEKNSLPRHGGGWTRVLIEKPIGTDRDSAADLNQLLTEYFEEDQIFRLDHYLGKETLQEVLNFRFNSSTLESEISNTTVDHIQVTAAEDYGIGLRGSYYDQNGALKDVGQNHLLQMIALATMNKPGEFTNEAVTAERVNILKSLVPEPTTLVIGQYKGFHQEQHISPDSLSETFFAFRTTIDNDRFSGVPIYVRGGKYLTKIDTVVHVVFKNSDVLTYRLSDQGGITLQTSTSTKEFANIGDRVAADAYDRLILDALKGDQTYFNDTAEIDAQWVFTDALLAQKHGMKPIIYEKGSWGPAQADELIQKDGRSWI